MKIFSNINKSGKLFLEQNIWHFINEVKDVNQVCKVKKHMVIKISEKNHN